jgi:hypothetical protein
VRERFRLEETHVFPLAESVMSRDAAVRRYLHACDAA